MKDLEELYIENYLVPVKGVNRFPSGGISIKERIEKIQGLFSSLKLGLQQLKHDFEQKERADNGFSETIDTIDGAIDTPHAIFDSTFFKSRERF
jgi:hypothetical protein